MGQYYVLSQEGEPVFIPLRDEPGYGRILALAVYTSEDGGQQREDLQRYKDTEVMAISGEDLLDAVDHGMPSTVYLDGTVGSLGGRSPGAQEGTERILW
jgi:hypothetical protein